MATRLNVEHAMTPADCDEYFKTEDEKRPQEALAKRLAEVRERRSTDLAPWVKWP